MNQAILNHLFSNYDPLGTVKFWHFYLAIAIVLSMLVTFTYLRIKEVKNQSAKF